MAGCVRENHGMLHRMSLEPAPCSPWRPTASSVVYSNRWTTVCEDQLVGPGGQPGLYAYFAPRDAVLIVPLYDNGTVVLVRQWRYVWGCSSWELPCGAVESGESVDAAAARELAEEAGLAARIWTRLSVVHPSDARVGGVTHIFLARSLSPVAATVEETECDLTRERVGLRDAVAATADGRITHVASAYALHAAERLLALGGD
jgi:8-oxo-dGTP pyrophosphatase MutT (NUDIX family)